MATIQDLSVSVTKTDFNNNEIITFNVGGSIYSTKRSTINENVDPQSYLSLIIKNELKIHIDEYGRYFIDRDGKYFSYILNYFREKTLTLPDNIYELKNILSEAKFYQIDGLINEIENRLNITNEISKKSQNGFQFILISKLNHNKRILKLIGPLQFIYLFHIDAIGKQFLNIISTFNSPKNILCQFIFPYDDRSISLQPLDQLQRFVLTKQAKKMGLIVSYSDDYFYISTNDEMMTRDKFITLVLNKYNGKLLNTNVANDESHILIENWFLTNENEEMYSNGSIKRVY